MSFLPRQELLTIEELDRLCTAFVQRGIRKLRVSGGEPLVRKGIMDLFGKLSRHVESGELDELTLTTNGTKLAEYATQLVRFGVKRVNVSLDSLSPTTYARITRGGNLEVTLQNIEAAIEAGLCVKINTVALREDNRGELASLAKWAHERGADITFIEVMPMGSVDQDRIDQFLPLNEVRRDLEQQMTLTDSAYRSGGPARYVQTEHGRMIGFITPLSNNFCGSCNRIRLTCTGRLYLCLAGEAGVDLRAPLRSSGQDDAIHDAIDAAIGRKPEKHEFRVGRALAPSVARHMSMTGG